MLTFGQLAQCYQKHDALSLGVGREELRYVIIVKGEATSTGPTGMRYCIIPHHGIWPHRGNQSSLVCS